jgi:hypothetical protein
MTAQDGVDRIIDVLPENLRCLVMKGVQDEEHFLAAVEGIKGEALVVTDKGVHIIKDKDTEQCSFFPFSGIAAIKIYRELRRGKFELFLRGEKRPEKALRMGYEADPSAHVVNFPFAKTAVFKKVEAMIRKYMENAMLGAHR